MLTPLETYKLYIAIHNHFTSSYDYFRYNGKTRVTVKHYEKRRDKYYFAKLSKHPDVMNLMIANFALGKVHWIGDLLTEEARSTYQAWKVRNQSLTYTFKEDLKKLEDNFNDNFKVWDGQHPTLMRLYLRDEISPETLCILMKITGCKKLWEKSLNEIDPVWDDIKLLSEKYTPFIKYDLETFKKICLTHFKQ